jgi:competence protein ComEC
MHFLSVGHGAMALFHAPDGRTYLFDCGAMSIDGYQQVLRPFLRAEHLRPPSAVFLSHSDADHRNALPDLLSHTPPQTVYVSDWFGAPGEIVRAGNPRDESLADPAVDALLAQVEKAGARLARLEKGQTIDLCPGARVEVLWPPARAAAGAAKLSSNDTSMVLRVVAGQRSVLLPGDLEKLGVHEIASLPPSAVHCAVMALPHHGAHVAGLRELVLAAGAELLVQSSSFRRDNQEFLKALCGKLRLTTFRAGWIAVDLGGRKMSIQTMRGD